jgi:hypothetical protein
VWGIVKLVTVLVVAFGLWRAFMAGDRKRLGQWAKAAGIGLLLLVVF